ncbi:MAG TPA: UDP-glucuronic acid decarboxylase family protein [Abditibacteriaceae bacterium]|jgi:dTDP-glucose 4,6-dehydratase
MRIVITGGAGFLGSHLIERCLAEGHEVVAVDNLITGSLDNLTHINSPKFSFRRQNVSEGILIDGAVDFILHFASPASPVDYMEMPIQTLKVGALGTHNALGLARAKGAGLLLASTSEIYGDPHVHPQTEDYWGNVNPIGPRSCYDESKRFAEAIVMAYHRMHNIDTKIVRIFNTYGPRMRIIDGRIVPNFLKQAILGEPLTVYGDGSQTRSFCFATDLVDGIYRLMMSEENLPVNIGNPTEFNILEFAEQVKRITNSSSEIVFRPLPQDDPKQRKPDITRARTILGWEPKIQLEEGLQLSIPYFKEKLGA